MKITKQSINLVSDEINAVLNKHFDGKFSFKVSGGSFAENTAKLSLSLTTTGAKSDEMVNLEYHACIHNLDVEKIAMLYNARFQLVKYNARAKKYPWVVQSVADKTIRYKITQATAINLFRRIEENTKSAFTSNVGATVEEVFE